MFVKVNISSIKDPSHFELTLDENWLHEHLETLSIRDIGEVRHQQVYVCDPSDKLWKRGKYVGSTGNSVIVSLIDGNQKVSLSKDNVFILPTSVPNKSVFCSLWTPFSVTWTPQQVMKFMQYEFTQGLMAQFHFQEEISDLLEVTLEERHGDVSCWLTFPDWFQLTCGLVQVLHIQSLEAIYVLPEVRNAYMRMINETTDPVGKSATPLCIEDVNQFKVDKKVVLYFSEVLELWIRARITDYDDGKRTATLQSMDYGRQDQLDVSQNVHKLVNCPEYLSLLPPAAVSYAYFCSHNHNYSPEDISTLESKTAGRSIFADVVVGVDAVIPSVRLFDCNKKNKEFVKSKSSVMAVNEFPKRVNYWDGECVITTVDDSGEQIHICMICDKVVEETISTYLSQRQKAIKQVVNVGDPCVVLSDDTKEYYRANVKSVNGSEYLAYHIDTGFEEMTKLIFEIHPDILKYYPIAIACSTVCNEKPLDKNQIEELSQFSLNVVRLRVRFLSVQDQIEISLFNKSKEIFRSHKSAISLASYPDVSFKMTPVTVGRLQYRPWDPATGNPANLFYINLEKDLDIADRISKEILQDTLLPIPPGTELLGKACTVVSDWCNLNYRGRVLRELEFGNLYVELVDRGDCVYVDRSKVMMATPFLLSVGPLAVKVDHDPDDAILSRAEVPNSPVLFACDMNTGKCTGRIGSIAARKAEKLFDKFDGLVCCQFEHECFYVRRRDETGMLANVESQLSKTPNNLNPKWSTVVGMDFCVASSSTSNTLNCRRGRLQSLVDSQMVEIHFLDNGNVETVPRSSLKQLSPSLYDIPALAIKCFLNDVHLPFDMNTLYSFTICGGNKRDGWYVTWAHKIL